MALASGSKVGISYVAESTRGVTPGAPTMKALRVTSRNINLQRSLLESAEVRADRQFADARHGFNQVSGSFGFELSVKAFDDMIASAFAGSWSAQGAGAAVTSTPLDLDVNASGQITRAAGSFVTDGFTVGMRVVTSGFGIAINNGTWTITAVAALTMTLNQPLIPESGSGDELVVGTESAGQIVKVGAGTLSTFSIERRFTDIARYQVFRGCAINGLSLNIQPGQIVGGTLEWVGMAAGPPTGTTLGSPTAAPTGAPLSAFEGAILLDGTPIGVVTGLNVQLRNNRSVVPVVGTQFSPDVFEGRARVDGQITAFLEDTSVLQDAFFAETEVEIRAKLYDPNNVDYMVVTLPRVKINASDIDPPQEGPITLNAPFLALYDATDTTTAQIFTTIPA